MKLIRLDPGSVISLPTAVCLGQFDGVHRGHQALIRAASDIARAQGLALCVHTFDPSPASLLHPGTAELTSLDEKVGLLAALGVELCAVSAFDDSLRRTPGETFFREVLLSRLHAAQLIAGFHHRFGAGSDTDVHRLTDLCAAAGIGLTIVPPVTLTDGTLISSTAIRQALAAGDTERAREMLGHPLPRQGILA